MKKMLVILLAGLVIMGAGCANKQTETTYFDKKVKCSTYLDQATKKYVYMYSALEELFYSPTKDSCLVLIHNLATGDSAESYHLYDMLSGLYLDAVVEDKTNETSLSLRSNEMLKKYR